MEARNEDATHYPIAPRELTAVEHPLIIKNLDKGLKTFGRKPDFDVVCDP